jgi:Tfp pilus assembly protein PilX
MKVKNQQGQALITLLFFMIIGVTLLTAASIVTLGNVASTSSAEQGTIAYYNAEAGIEDALIQILRYPPGYATSYNGTTITLPNNMGTATITVNPSTTTSPPPSTISIISVGFYGSAKRTVVVVETNGATGWTQTSWQEQ